MASWASQLVIALFASCHRQAVELTPGDQLPVVADHGDDRQVELLRELTVALVGPGTAMIAPVPYSIST